MSERTCTTPECAHPSYALGRCKGCYYRHREGRTPKPWVPLPRREPIVAPSGEARVADLQRIQSISDAFDASPGLKPDDKAVLQYALRAARKVGSEQFEISGRRAAQEIGIPDRSMRSAIARLIKLGWLDSVEQPQVGLTPRYKLQVGQDKPPRLACAWDGCDRPHFAQGLCKRCYARQAQNGGIKQKKTVHRLTDLDAANRTAVCPTCGPVSGIRVVCRDGYVWGICSAIVKRNARARIAKQYGLTPEQYDSLLANQQGRCAICRDKDSLNVDHDHETGAVRELLCRRCNFAVGHLRDSPRLARKLAAYLERHAQQALPL